MNAVCILAYDHGATSEMGILSMVALPTDHRAQFTVEEYFALEAASQTRHEYYHGEIIAMSGAKREHTVITSNVVREFGNQLENRPHCTAVSSDQRVRVSGKIYFYPDVVVACDEEYDDTGMMLINPYVVVEVTSDSTGWYDRSTKLEAYKQMPSVQDILIVDQDRVRVEQHTRMADGWFVREFLSLDQDVKLASIGCVLPVRKIYSKVTLPV